MYQTLIPGILPLIAIAAIDGFVSAGLKRNLGGGAATITDYFVHLTIAIASSTAIAVTAVGAARGATARLICEAFLGEESLFRCCEGEFGAAITADKSFIGVHRCTS